MAKPTKLSLMDVLEKHQDAARDWDTERDEYLGRVKSLYTSIRTWMAPSVKKGFARVSSGGVVTLREGGLPPYKVTILNVDVGRRRIRFEPKGFQIVGARGRVDIDAGDRIGVLVYNNDGWSFARRQPERKLFKLNESTFTEAIAELLGE